MNIQTASYHQAAEWPGGRMPAYCTEGGVQTPGGEPKNFQNGLSSAETQQPVDRMLHKLEGTCTQ